MAQPHVTDVMQTGEIRNESSRQSVEAATSTKMAAMEDNGEKVVAREEGVTYGVKSRMVREHIPNFEEALKDIDDAMHNYSQNPNLNAADPVTADNKVVNSYNLVDIEIMEEDHSGENQMPVLKGNSLENNYGAKQPEGDSNMGWVDTGLKGAKPDLPRSHVGAARKRRGRGG
nr:hypothetical protein CFP56_41766 [Quercus suber]